MGANLPRLTTFTRVAEQLGRAQELGFPAGWSLRVRTIAFKHQDAWLNYATSADLVEGPSNVNALNSLRESVVLTERHFPIAGPLAPSVFASYLMNWRTALKLEPSGKFQEHVYFERGSSDFRRLSWPGWSASLHIEGGAQQLPLPDGPFFDPKALLFGEDIPQLTVQFLGETRFAGQHNASNEYMLRIPDRRVRINALTVEENVLRVGVDNPASKVLYCSVIASSFSDEVFHRVVPMDKSRTDVELPFTVQNLKLWIILENGYCLDHYEETPHRSTWGLEASLFNAPRKVQLHAIGQALAGGENDKVEFKPYIKLRPRDKKSFEVLRAVSGFANSGGGDVYFGVNDEAEPVGIETDLTKDYGEDNRQYADRQAAYEKDLRKLINEGTTPTLPLEFQWHTVAHRTILQLRVPPSNQPVHLVENGEIYRRVGSTNKKWRAVDAQASSHTSPTSFSSFSGH